MDSKEFDYWCDGAAKIVEAMQPKET